MSFRTRLTSFFLLIVMVPMTAVGILVFRLIDDSQQGKADARANGIASAAASVYEQASRSASYDARTVARALENASGRVLTRRAAALVAQVGIVRVTVSDGARTIADVGRHDAIAPGLAIVRGSGSRPARTITLSELTAAQYAGQLSGSGFGVVVRQNGRTMASTLPAASQRPLPRFGQISLGGRTYQAVTTGFGGFGAGKIEVTVLSDAASTGGSVGADRLVAALFILAFVVLAASFAFLASKALQGQLGEFLEAARRLGAGDFSARVPTHGNDEFAALGDEFNSMAEQLRHRLTELELEQARVRRSIRNIGEAFASNLDRDGLLELALRTAMDATSANRGRISAREHAERPLSEVTHFGRLDGLEQPILASERAALAGDGLGEASGDDLSVATVALGAMTPGGPTHGLITVIRAGRPFSADDHELLRSLAIRASLALANVHLHHDVQRQAVTDDLTGLTTHGHFQELLSLEMEEVRRYSYSVGLVMLDLDDFKAVNDLHGHQQGDIVLRTVAEIMGETKRDVDVAARYGGEELALILPHTDLEGTFATAERLREAIEQAEIPLLKSGGNIRVTASVGVAASSEGDKNELITAADAALYAAKRDGKNRTVRADADTAEVFSTPVRRRSGTPEGDPD
ncbi:MAG TPA: diguanylate cyclase [Solirubrobacteraceae bacterium]